MKTLIFCLLLLSSSAVYCQTRDKDVDFVTGSYLQNTTDDDYKITNSYTGGYTDPGSKIKYVVEIKKFSSSDGKARGMILLYYELLKNEKSNKRAYCIPVRGSDNGVEIRCLRAITDISDPNQLKVILWALAMNCSKE